VFENCSFPGDMHVHIHPGYNMRPGSTGGREAAVAAAARRVLAVAHEVGLAILPDRSGEPRMFVLAATPAVREWIDSQFEADSPAWLVDNGTTVTPAGASDHWATDNDGQRTVTTTESASASQE
jgi:hypothetical protein